jgi:hypothetical protein
MSAFRLALVLAAWVLASSATEALSSDLVQVVVDLDSATPGLQSHLTVPAGTTRIDEVAIYLFDPRGERRLWGIGYLGGIDRGLTFGHTPTNRHVGKVGELVASPGTTANPGNSFELITRPFIIPAFDGPEIQYLEFGANEAATLPSSPVYPLFTVDVVLGGAQPGDIYDFYVLDYVSMWSQGQHGVFSVEGPLTLDTGGDVVPDGTQTAFGTDPDPSIPVPPAAYLVDFIDGANLGPATITIASAAGIDGGTSAPPRALALEPARPSPFTRATRLEYELAAPATVRLAVYDVGGRMVQELLNGPVPAGRQRIEWNGRGVEGAAPAGVYFIRLEAAGRAASQRVVLAR